MGTRYEVLNDQGEVVNRILASAEFMQENYQSYREEAPEETPPATFAERQAALLRSVDLLARDKRNAIVADISPSEMASWSIKRAEALAYQSSGLDADAPNLVVEAGARNSSLSDLVAKVLTKAGQLSYVEAQIAGHAGKLQDQLSAAQDQAALDLIDINAGWPV